MEYQVEKRQLKKDKIDYLEIFFDNGDFLPISSSEIVDISVNLYDELVLGQDYWNSFCSVVQSGFLKLKVDKKPKDIYCKPILYNLKEYNKDRIGYIKDRLCAGQDNVVFIRVFDFNNWHFTLYCKAESTFEKDCIILKFLPHQNKEYKSKNHFILLPDIKKSIIEKIELDFENCEGIWIDKNEIVDMQIKLKDKLCGGSDDYSRVVDKGFIRIKFDKTLNSCRENGLFEDLSAGKKGNKQMESRLCGKNKIGLHDICNLYLEYEYAGYGIERKECVEIPDARSKDELLKISEWEDENLQEFMPCYIGGYAEKQDDDSILICFGSTNKRYEDEYHLFEQCSIDKL